MIKTSLMEIRPNRWIVKINGYRRGPVMRSKEEADIISEWLRVGGYDDIIKSPVEENGVDIDD